MELSRAFSELSGALSVVSAVHLATPHIASKSLETFAYITKSLAFDQKTKFRVFVMHWREVPRVDLCN